MPSIEPSGWSARDGLLGKVRVFISLGRTMATIISALVGGYALILEQAFICRYGDAPQILGGLVGRYNDAAQVQAALVGAI